MELPGEFLNAVAGAPGIDLNTFVEVHASGEQVTSVRLNPLKPATLLFQPGEKIPWNSYGYYLDARPSFTLDPLFHAGAYYVQEASSMFIEQYFKHIGKDSIRVLDLCAAPGGKSTLLQSLLPEGSLLVSNEIIRQRQNILLENITRWGASNVVVTGNDAGSFSKLEDFFDVMVVDAPCSGSGLFRKDDDAVDEWSLSQVLLCAGRQKEILSAALPSLRHGGLLIYSTCSYSVEEDEAIADWILEQGLEPFKINGSLHPGIVESTTPGDAQCFRFYPDKIKGEGFFVSAFINGRGGQRVYNKGKKGKLKKVSNTMAEAYLLNSGDFSFIEANDNLVAIPLHLEEVVRELQQALYIRKAGITLGSVMKNQLVPSQELAMSVDYSRNLPECEIDLTNALEYLRRRDANFGNASKGWNLVTFRGLGLGWMKNVGNRVNNYYPREWRIQNM